ncbi:MAG: aldehyde ferredoxin oxidoreductase, partial [Spirochaetes bacterium]|nr:aldehyde ferredoxin oxidoreductase [Spirochaetota bacterium]
MSDTTSRIEEPSAALYEKFIGGKGLAGYYLSRSIRLSWDDPGMPLLFFTGPLVDTPSPTSGRMAIVSRS